MADAAFALGKLPLSLATGTGHNNRNRKPRRECAGLHCQSVSDGLLQKIWRPHSLWQKASVPAKAASKNTPLKMSLSTNFEFIGIEGNQFERLTIIHHQRDRRPLHYLEGSIEEVAGVAGSEHRWRLERVRGVCVPVESPQPRAGRSRIAVKFAEDGERTCTLRPDDVVSGVDFHPEALEHNLLHVVPFQRVRAPMVPVLVEGTLVTCRPFNANAILGSISAIRTFTAIEFHGKVSLVLLARLDLQPDEGFLEVLLPRILAADLQQSCLLRKPTRILRRPGNSGEKQVQEQLRHHDRQV